MVARSTPDRKVIRSSRVGVKLKLLRGSSLQLGLLLGFLVCFLVPFWLRLRRGRDFGCLVGACITNRPCCEKERLAWSASHSVLVIRSQHPSSSRQGHPHLLQCFGTPRGSGWAAWQGSDAVETRCGCWEALQGQSASRRQRSRAGQQPLTAGVTGLLGWCWGVGGRRGGVAATIERLVGFGLLKLRPDPHSLNLCCLSFHHSTSRAHQKTLTAFSAFSSRRASPPTLRRPDCFALTLHAPRSRERSPACCVLLLLACLRPISTLPPPPPAAGPPPQRQQTPTQPSPPSLVCAWALRLHPACPIAHEIRQPQPHQQPSPLHPHSNQDVRPCPSPSRSWTQPSGPSTRAAASR